MAGGDLMFVGLFLGLSLTLGLGVMAFAGDPGAKKAAKRLETIRERHMVSREAQAKAQMKRIVAARSHNKLDSFAGRFVPKPAELRARLQRTGKNWSIGGYAIACAIVVLMVLLLGIIAGAPFLLVLFLGLFAGIGLPHLVVGMMIKKRAAAFTTRFPDAIDLLVRGLRSGLPVTESLGVVGREVPDPVGVEFRLIADKIRIGRTMEEALAEATQRLDTPEFQFFVITLAIQRETGGNLAETLHNLGDVLRKRAQMKLKIKAMSSEAKASAYIVGALPFVVAILVQLANPEYLAPFLTDTRLMIAAGGGLFWMSCGVAVMAKMVRFEI